MAQVYETQTFQADPNASPVVNLNLNKNFNVLETAIITNIVKPSGVREITLGLHYDDAVTTQHSISLETFLVGNSITDITDVALSDIQTIQFTEFIEHTLVNDSVSVTVLTLSTVGAQVNNVSTQKFQLDPSNPITTGIPLIHTGLIIECILVNVGSIARPSDVGAGTINSVFLYVGVV